MANIMLKTFNKLKNNSIDCNDDNDIIGLNFLIQNHPDENIKNQAVITLVKCGKSIHKSGGKLIRKTRKHVKNRKYKKSKKNRKSRKSRKSRKYKTNKKK